MIFNIWYLIYIATLMTHMWLHYFQSRWFESSQNYIPIFKSGGTFSLSFHKHFASTFSKIMKKTMHFRFRTFWIAANNIINMNMLLDSTSRSSFYKSHSWRKWQALHCYYHIFDGHNSRWYEHLWAILLL